nr:hypothetical protein [Myxococcota bacterium]
GSAPGGAGAAGAISNGTIGSSQSGDGGGGGGAIGRIRINTLTGSATVTGTLSPSFADPSSTCTQGTVTLE